MDTLQRALVGEGVLPEGYDFEAHRELVPIQPEDVVETCADCSELERDFGYRPATRPEDGLRAFARWYRVTTGSELLEPLLERERTHLKSVLSVLHITDLHVGSSLPSGYELKIERAVDAAVAEIDSDQLFIVVSGDVANTGDAKEYDVAERVIACLLEVFSERHKGSVDLVIVPGNHDVSNPPQSIPKVRDEEVRAEQLAKMGDFFCFSICRGIEWENRDVLIASHRLSSDSGFSEVRFCCLNTAPFSTLTFDKGVHTLSRAAFASLSKGSPSELSVVVAHHGPEWLDDAPRLEFESEASSSIDMLLVGHEHRGGTVVEGALGKAALPVFRGGTFSLDDEKECTFSLLNIGPCQAGSYRVDEIRFQWDSSSRIFTCHSRNSLTSAVKSLVPRPREEYLKSLPDEVCRDEDFFDVSFSFPRLRSDASLLPEGDGLATRQPVIIESPDDLFSYLEEWSFVEIVGSVGSGKSCLARDIYIECARRGLIPILIHPDNSTRAFDRTLDSLIGEQYGSSPAEIAAFRQAPREKKVIIADDFDRIKRVKRNDPWPLIRQMLESFGKVVIMVSGGNDTFSRALVEGDAGGCGICGSLELCACTKQVRDPLVTKLCQAADLDAKVTDRMIRAVDRAVRGHVGLFELTPAFITQYVDYYLVNQAEMLSQEELPFRHIFDFNIRRSMLEAAKSLGLGRWDVQLANVAVAALQDVAFQMHIQRKSVMDARKVSGVIATYGESHDVEVRPGDVMEVARKAKILSRLEDGFSCMFSSLYVHAYFVAKRIDAALDLREPGVDEQIDRLLDEICFPVNQEVIVFLSQLRLSVEFPERLIQRARRIVGDDCPQGLFDPQRHISLRPLIGLKVSAIGEDRARALSAFEDRIESEENSQIEGLEYADYYENDVRTLEMPVIRALMAVKYAELAAGYLVRHYARMPKDAKRDIREAIFQIPQGAADVVISDIDSRFEEIVAEISDPLTAGMEGTADAETFSQRFVAAVSIGFTYCFIGAVIAHASEDRATVSYLIDVEGDSFGHLLGKLCALNFIGDSRQFTDLAVSAVKRARESGGQIELIVIKVLVNQYLRENERIDLSDKHRLLRGVFDLPGDSSNAPLGLRGR